MARTSKKSDTGAKTSRSTARTEKKKTDSEKPVSEEVSAAKKRTSRKASSGTLATPTSKTRTTGTRTRRTAKTEKTGTRRAAKKTTDTGKARVAAPRRRTTTSEKPTARVQRQRKAPIVVEVSAESPEPASVLEVTASKYAMAMERPQVVQPAIPDEHLGELPESYGRDRLVLIPRDPEWVFIYWEMSDNTYRAAMNDLSGRPILRLRLESKGAESVRDVEVMDLMKGRYYARALGDEMTVWAELGLRGSEGGFQTLLRSQKARMPRSHGVPSEPKFVTIPFDMPLDPQSGRVGAELEGRLLTESEFRNLFGKSHPGSMPRR